MIAILADAFVKSTIILLLAGGVTLAAPSLRSFAASSGVDSRLRGRARTAPGIRVAPELARRRLAATRCPGGLRPERDAAASRARCHARSDCHVERRTLDRRRADAESHAARDDD